MCKSDIYLLKNMIQPEIVQWIIYTKPIQNDLNFKIWAHNIWKEVSTCASVSFNYCSVTSHKTTDMNLKITDFKKTSLSR